MATQPLRMRDHTVREEELWMWRGKEPGCQALLVTPEGTGRRGTDEDSRGKCVCSAGEALGARDLTAPFCPDPGPM